MTDDTAPRDTPTDSAMPERARIEPPPPKRLDALPVLYIVGFLILASAVLYLWRHPTTPRAAALQAVHVDTMRQQIETLAQQVAALQAAQKTVPDTSKLEGRVAALEGRPMPATANIGPLEARVASLEGRPVPAPVDLKPLEGKVAALEAKPPVDLAPLNQKVDALGKSDAEAISGVKRQVDQVEAQGKQNAAAIAAVTQRAQLASRLTSMSAALAAGQPLGELPAGAPASLTRFAHDAPPTEAGLRLSFDKAALAAHDASQPALAGNKPFLERMWSRASQSLTVRQGDTVLVGDPIAGVVEHARQQLEAGDLGGAVGTLKGGLTGPALGAMSGWIGQAQALLDARKAIGELAAQR